MMSCKDVANLASDYLEKDLPLLRRLSLRLHLFMCTDCRRFVQGIRTLAGSASALRGAGDPAKYDRLAYDLTGGTPNGSPRTPTDDASKTDPDTH